MFLLYEEENICSKIRFKQNAFSFVLGKPLKKLIESVSMLIPPLNPPPLYCERH